MSKLGDALGFSMKGASPADDAAPPSDPGDDGMGMDEAETPAEKPKAASAEEMAMKMFDRAATPAAKVEALKAFGEACGWGGGDY